MDSAKMKKHTCSCQTRLLCVVVKVIVTIKWADSHYFHI